VINRRNGCGSTVVVKRASGEILVVLWQEEFKGLKETGYCEKREEKNSPHIKRFI